mmetsp:Transcript_25937/g.40270  ORF Transcript_25937/g.40270 Transcript_25937/m.40270 type:complete len:106 (-) Transcript_25937:6-323(-)
MHENPLHVALQTCYRYFFVCTTSRDADVTVKDDNGHFPTHIAIQNQNESSLKTISRLAALNPTSPVENGRHGLTPLNLVIHHSRADKLRFLQSLKLIFSLKGEKK